MVIGYFNLWSGMSRCENKNIKNVLQYGSFRPPSLTQLPRTDKLGGYIVCTTPLMRPLRGRKPEILTPPPVATQGDHHSFLDVTTSLKSELIASCVAIG